MSELRSYAAALEREIIPPALADLERVAARRDRARNGIGLAAAVLAIGAVFTLYPGGTDDSLPAIPPTPTPTSTFVAGTVEELMALTPEQVVGKANAHEGTSRVDDHPAVIESYRVCVPRSGPDILETRPCRTVWEVKNGQRKMLIEPDDLGTSGYVGRPEHLGAGVFVPTFARADGPSPYLIDANTMKMVELRAGTGSGPPGHGRHLFTCSSSLPCIVDVPAGTYELLTPASLPSWVSTLREMGDGSLSSVGYLNGGEVAYALLNGLGESFPQSTPLLVAESMTAAVPMTEGPPLAPRPGILWVHGRDREPWQVDIPGRTLRKIDLPAAEEWSHITVDGFWGIKPNDAGDFTAIWVDARGKAVTRDLPTAVGSHVRIAEGNTTGEMTYYEVHVDGSAHLHVSADRGKTWRIRTVPTAVAANLNKDSRIVPGWESWPEVR